MEDAQLVGNIAGVAAAEEDNLGDPCAAVVVVVVALAWVQVGWLLLGHYEIAVTTGSCQRKGILVSRKEGNRHWIYQARQMCVLLLLESWVVVAC